MGRWSQTCTPGTFVGLGSESRLLARHRGVVEMNPDGTIVDLRRVADDEFVGVDGELATRVSSLYDEEFEHEGSFMRACLPQERGQPTGQGPSLLCRGAMIPRVARSFPWIRGRAKPPRDFRALAGAHCGWGRMALAGTVEGGSLGEP